MQGVSNKTPLFKIGQLVVITIGTHPFYKRPVQVVEVLKAKDIYHYRVRCPKGQMFVLDERELVASHEAHLLPRSIMLEQV